MEEAASAPPVIELPRGMYNARLDDRGRIKLPTDFQTALESLGGEKLFVTSLDRRIGQIYPMAKWREFERFLESGSDDPTIARSMLFNATDLGGEVLMDSQGRVVFPPDLRRTLGIEGQAVRIYAYQGRIEVLSEDIYAARRQEASQVTSDDVIRLEAKRPK